MDFQRCDVEDCFCVDEPPPPPSSRSTQATAPELTKTESSSNIEAAEDTVVPASELATDGTQTPALETPVEEIGTPPPNNTKENEKVLKNLKKVKKALKILGVNVIEFDHGGDGNKKKCEKEYCRLGCVCESIVSKSIPPAHCGKIDCMFRCYCSEDSLKKFSSARKVGISPAGFAKLQETSTRNLAAEERKFHNTVVTTSGGSDLIMLSGRQKRERKVPTRYQDADTLVLDPNGKDYIPNPAGDDAFNDQALLAVGGRTNPSIIKTVSDHLKENTARKCTVIVPKITLPKIESLGMWCMFHSQYNCPCTKFINPLDYGPDISGSRNVAKRSSKKPFKTTPTHSNEPTPPTSTSPTTLTPSPIDTLPLDDDDDDDDDDVISLTDRRPATPPPEMKKIKKVKRRLSSAASSDTSVPEMISDPDSKFPLHIGECSRTVGFAIKPNNKTKMPHKFVQKKKSPIKVVGPPNPKEGASSIPKETSQEVVNHINLRVAEKNVVQYVNWNLFRELFKKDHIKVWFYCRGGKSVFFATYFAGRPYVANAVDTKDLIRHTENKTNLPEMASSLITPILESEKNKFAILTSNGLAWEITGILQKKSAAPPASSSAAATAPSITNNAETNNSTNEVAKITEPTTSVEKTTPIVSEVLIPACNLDLNLHVQKLPIGQHIVTVARSAKATMQIKLPPTAVYQHWSTLRVSDANLPVSIQCPDSTLALKSAVLKQAAELSMKEQTTVRIPIPVSGEVSSFGVYAVPGLSSHVFVGPFSNKNKLEKGGEVICLDDEEEEDDDVVIIPDPRTAVDVPQVKSVPTSTNRRKQKLMTKLDEDDTIKNYRMVMSIMQNVADRAVIFGERKKKRAMYSKRAVMATVPIVVTEENNKNEIVEVEGGAKSKNQANVLKRKVDSRFVNNPPGYINLPTSTHGKILIHSKSLQDVEGVWKQLLAVSQNNLIRRAFQAKITPEGSVYFAHPKFANHVVYCPSKEEAINWMAEFQESERVKTNEISSPSPTPIRNNVLSDIVANVDSLTESTIEFDNDGQNGLAIVLKDEKRNEQMQLFYELGHVTFSNYMKKNLSRIQILQGAKDEILALQKSIKEHEVKKKEMLERRSKLFDEFTSKLKGLPTSTKKKFVVDLKEGLKKAKAKKATISPASVQPLIAPPSSKTEKSEQNVTTKKRPPPNLIPINPETGLEATPYTDVTGLKTTLDKSGKVRRPMNAFMLWAKNRRSALINNG